MTGLVFPNASLPKDGFGAVFSQTQVSEDNLAVKFQFSPEIPVKPTAECCIVSALKMPKNSSFAAGSTQDIKHKSAFEQLCLMLLIAGISLTIW